MAVETVLHRGQPDLHPWPPLFDMTAGAAGGRVRDQGAMCRCLLAVFGVIEAEIGARQRRRWLPVGSALDGPVVTGHARRGRGPRIAARDRHADVAPLARG